jgi:hypothetical protein
VPEPILSGPQFLGALFVLAWLLIAVALLVDKRWPLAFLDDEVVADDRLLDYLGSALPDLADPDDELTRLLVGCRREIEALSMPDLPLVTITKEQA